MAFDSLDASLRRLQTNLVNQSNSDLVFGGTTKSEFDFLSRAGMQNTGAPNFFSFMAGISASNLAEQQARQTQFTNAAALRKLESDLTGAESRAGVNDANAATIQAQLPYAGQQARADVNRTASQTRVGNANAATTEAQLPYIPQQQEANIGLVDARTGLVGQQTAQQGIENQYLPQFQQSRIDVNQSQANRNDRYTQPQSDSGYQGYTWQQSAGLPQPRAAVPAQQAPVGILPPPVANSQLAPVQNSQLGRQNGQQPQALATDSVQVLRGLLAKSAKDFEYAPSPLELAEYQKYQQYLSLGGSPLNLR